jgi:hypothetical protein
MMTGGGGQDATSSAHSPSVQLFNDDIFVTLLLSYSFYDALAVYTIKFASVTAVSPTLDRTFRPVRRKNLASVEKEPLVKKLFCLVRGEDFPRIRENKRRKTNISGKSAPIRLFLFKIGQNLAADLSGCPLFLRHILSYAVEKSASWQYWYFAEHSSEKKVIFSPHNTSLSVHYMRQCKPRH